MGEEIRSYDNFELNFAGLHVKDRENYTSIEHSKTLYRLTTFIRKSINCNYLFKWSVYFN